MLILGIETSGGAGSVALCEGREVRAEYYFPEGPRHSRNIMLGVDSVIGEAGTSKDRIDAVAVSQGPGSFTGLRVGVMCAKSLAYALRWKAIGVSSLEVKARNVDPDEPGAPEHVCPVLDARRSCVYAMILRNAGGRWDDTTGVLLGRPEEIAEKIPRDALIFGSGVGKYPDVFNEQDFTIGPDALEQGHAREVARLAAPLLDSGADVSPIDLLPKYHRPTAAEEKFGRVK